MRMWMVPVEALFYVSILKWIYKNLWLEDALSMLEATVYGFHSLTRNCQNYASSVVGSLMAKDNVLERWVIRMLQRGNMALG